MIRYAAITWLSVANTMCSAPLPTEGIWEVEVTEPPVGACTDRLGVPFNTPRYLAIEHATSFDGISMFSTGEHVMKSGRLYARAGFDGRSFTDRDELPWMVSEPSRFCSYHLKRMLSGRLRNRDTVEWSETAMWFSGHRTPSGDYEPCIFPLDDPTLGDSAHRERIPGDIYRMPYDEAKAAWAERFPLREDPCIEERSYRATYFADELPPRPPRPRNAPNDPGRGYLILLEHLPPATVTDQQWDYRRRWSIEIEDQEPRTFWVERGYQSAVVPSGPVRVSLEQQGRSTGDEPPPWVPYGPQQTLLVGHNATGVVAAIGYREPPREQDLPLGFYLLRDFPMAASFMTSIPAPWDPDEPLYTRFIHSHPDGEYAVIDLWTLDDGCRPVASPPSHRGLSPGDYITDLVWPMGQPVVLGVDAGSDGTIDHCFRLPPREPDYDGGPIASFRRMWDLAADEGVPASIEIPWQNPWFVRPSD
jgi:hypothetical protein